MTNLDCLVLKLEEVECDSNNIDTTIYIIHDTLTNHFVVRGKRRDIRGNESYSYSFNCYKQETLIEFLLYVICEKNTVNETLYVFDNMPKHSDEITYDFLQRHENTNYEIAGYDNQQVCRNKISNLLDFLQNIFNLYN